MKGKREREREGGRRKEREKTRSSGQLRSGAKEGPGRVGSIGLVGVSACARVHVVCSAVHLTDSEFMDAN